MKWQTGYQRNIIQSHSTESPCSALPVFSGIRSGYVKKQLLHSGFYSEQTGDVPYTDALDLQAFFAARSRASFHLKTVRFDRAYRGGSCLVYSDGSTAQLECDIEQADFDPEKLPDLQAWLTAQLHDETAEYASISFTFDNEPLFEIRKGDAL